MYDLRPVLDALRLVIAQEGSHSQIKTEIKQVEALLSKQLAQYKADLGLDLQQSLTTHNVVLDEVEMSSRLHFRSTLESAWTDLKIGHTKDVSAEDLASYRRPSVEDVKAGVLALLQYESKYSRASHDFYNGLLQAITRNLPLYVERSSRTRRLLKIDLSEVRLRWETLSMATNPEGDTGLAVKSNYPTSQPTTGLGLFKKVWSRMRTRLTPTARSYAIALALETRLATWRVGAMRVAQRLAMDYDLSGDARYESDTKQKLVQRKLSALNIQPWQPVRDLCRAIYLTGELKTQHVNSILEGALQNEPVDDEVAHSETRWPTLRDAMGVFQLLHLNALHARSQAKDHQSAPNIKSATGELLGLDPSDLDNGISADRATYHIVMKGLISRGDLRGALQVFEQMTGSRIESFAASSVQERDRFGYTSARTFETFFYGFARYGVPSRLVALDENNIENSQWEATDEDAALHDEEPSPWTIEMLRVIIEACLSLQPNDPMPLRDESQFDDGVESHTSLIDQQSVHDFRSRSPSPQAIFDLITALRRVSSDQAEWVLHYFERIEEKFEAQGTPADVGEWIGWRLNARVHRSLKMLKSMRGF
jgi:pentatricopeptide repeat protein